MTRKVTVAGLAAGALVTAGIAAIESYRLGHKLTEEEHDHLHGLVKWLHAVDDGSDTPDHLQLVRFWGRLKDRGFIAPGRLASLVTQFRIGTYLDDQVVNFIESELRRIEDRSDLDHLA